MKNFARNTVTAIILTITLVTNAQKEKSQGVSFVLDMQPVLQIDMTSAEQINFVFDNKIKYRAGITKNEATIIKVTSTVKWDLYAVGRSKGKSANGKTYWDQEKSFASNVNSVADLPLSLLEIKQNHVNINGKSAVGKFNDYSRDLDVSTMRADGGNSLYVSPNGTPTPPSKTGKYIAGHSGIAEETSKNYMDAGSYISDDKFIYTIDYKILPGYPAIFPNAYNEDATVAQNIVANANAGTIFAGGVASNGNKSYAEPGVYTMNVQYVLLEDQ